MTTQKDAEQIAGHGLDLDQIQVQLDNFKTGFPYLSINRAAVVGDGIVSLPKEQTDCLVTTFDKEKTTKKIVKFVPASGAATRMFKSLFEFLDSKQMSNSVKQVIDKVEDFAFANTLHQTLTADASEEQIIEAIVSTPGLDYGNKPKALIEFHAYANGSRTAAEEHLVEGAMYASSDAQVNIHFTVSPEHLEGFKTLFAQVIAQYEQEYGVKYNISFSQQKKSTDTIAVTLDNEPFREADGSLLFRPAGHGALLSNLDEIDADIIYVKTIDNVAPDRLKADTITYKKCLGALVLETQAKVFDLIAQIDAQNTDSDFIAQCEQFINNTLNYYFAADFAQSSDEDKLLKLREVLNRPLRACGMVKNEGEPGGGPFWVASLDGSLSLQIAESSQISPEQLILMKQATHFNPVDLVCAVKDYKGEKFDLTKFVDPSTGFISTKSKNGRELKAQELPGLWNGSMAQWNTIFVEVPISTFSPVKEVGDLLREQHR